MGLKDIVAGIALLVVAGTASADALLQQALARDALAPGNVRGMLRTTTTVTGGDAPEVETVIVDPRKEPKKALASYAELKDVIGANAQVASRDAGRTVYTFTTRHVPKAFTRAGSVSVQMDGEGDDGLFDGTAEVSTDASGRPYVSHVDLRMHDGAGNFLARVKKIDIGYAFGPATGTDAMVATAMSVDVDVRALFFMHRNARAESTLVADNPR
ncbi:hypothetical protein [Luteibacter sp. 3190]|uniref:hypothetical protein n=1 Tax=Luteibacter sp. 3190 TaxID=2817736 RepID=UPI00285CCD04|nr:hypothetical protein [Luteibacter sp. 3190]MDR6935903.1 hypothetical protein [Luteibacter sp. 3190]